MVHFFGDSESDSYRTNKSLKKAIKGFELRYGNPAPTQDPARGFKGPVIVERVANGGMVRPKTWEFKDMEAKDILSIISYLRDGPPTNSEVMNLVPLLP